MKQAQHSELASDRAIRAEQGQQTEQKAIKTLMHVFFFFLFFGEPQHVVKWCMASINTRPQLFIETLNAANKT